MMGGGGMMGGTGFGIWGGLGALLNLVFTIALFGGLIWAVVWLFRRYGNNHQNTMLDSRGTTQQTPTPVQILKSRYAQGEINQEEYTRILQEIAE